MAAIILFEGADVFKPATCEFNVAVIKRDVFISANNVTTLAKSGDVVNITLTDVCGNPIDGEVIINNRTFNCTTGSVSLKLDLMGGNYLYYVSFSEDDIYKSAEAQFNVKVNKKGTTAICSNMIASTIVVKVDGKTGKYFKFTLKDSSGKAIKNKRVSVRFNGKTYSLTTNRYGAVTLQINVEKAGRYSISFKFNGDGEYKAVSKSAFVTVKKKTLKLFFNALWHKYIEKTKNQLFNNKFIKAL